MTEPQASNELIAPFLAQEQLKMSSERLVHFSMLVEIGRGEPGSELAVQEQQLAFTDDDEYADCSAAPKQTCR